MTETHIRPETPADLEAIRRINVAAFADHPYSRQTEHLIVDALRAAGALEVSLVAVRDDRPVVHIAFSRATVGDAAGGWFMLGPVAVLPEFQGAGIGSALVVAGLAELRARGGMGCVLVGDPAFYERLGFSNFPDLSHEGVPHRNVLGLALAGAAPSGAIHAHEAFLIAAAERPSIETYDVE